MSFTLAQLRTQAKRRADMENSSFVADAEWLDYINYGIARLHDLLVTNYEDEFISTHTFSTVSGTESYSLPSDFYKLKGVDAQIFNTDWDEVRRFNFNDRNSKPDQRDPRYRIMGSSIYISPTPDTAVSYKLWYTPVATKLSDDSDTFSDSNQYAEFVVIAAAIRALQKEESDTSDLKQDLMLLENAIKTASTSRDITESHVIIDRVNDSDFERWE